MFKYIKFLRFILILTSLLIVPRLAKAADLNYSKFSEIPILDQGRIKPLDTFARSYLQGFSAKDKLRERSAIEWLAELLFDQPKAFKREVFNIPNPQVVNALELDQREKHLYSYEEVAKAINSHMKLWQGLFQKSKEDLTLEQEQMVTLFNKVQVYADLAFTFASVFPEIRDQIPRVEIMAMHQGSETLRVVPSPWKQQTANWFSPWSIGQEGYGSPRSVELLVLWESLSKSYKTKNLVEWVILSKQIQEMALRMAGPVADRNTLSLEVSFNHWDLFSRSLVFYLIAFLLVLASFLFWKLQLRTCAFVFMAVGFLAHGLGIITRMVIMHRPPVTSLYESILFVSFIAVLFGIILERIKKNSMGIIIGASVGTFLHFLGLRYASDGDTMGMLVAVLNTNFWLATHVVCITIGYGCCLVCGIIGHMYLIFRLLHPNDREKHTELFNNLRGTCIVALFFASLGTILGGIWADQSWGRFWGWDPKENGALLIVLWLVWLIHGRISGRIHELGFVTGMALTNVVVALAWFGVNLLNVGLHSYGFTRNVTFNLALFCGSEIVFALGCYFVIRNQGKVKSRQEL